MLLGTHEFIILCSVSTIQGKMNDFAQQWQSCKKCSATNLVLISFRKHTSMAKSLGQTFFSKYTISSRLPPDIFIDLLVLKRLETEQPYYFTLCPNFLPNQMSASDQTSPMQAPIFSMSPFTVVSTILQSKLAMETAALNPSSPIITEPSRRTIAISKSSSPSPNPCHTTPAHL